MRSEGNENVQISVIAAVNNDGVLQGNLLKSPDEELKREVILERGFDSAAAAYNSAIARATGEILIFVHQDVYLPHRWVMALRRSLERLQASDPNWGVLGVFGVSEQGENCGHVYSAGLSLELGCEFDEPVQVGSLDELLLIMRRSAGLRFDESLPGFHLYGTDICLEAARRGLKNYVISSFCIHNSNGLSYLPMAFWRSYFYMQNKWREILPVKTACTTISRGYMPILAATKTSALRLLRGANSGKRSADPERLYRQLEFRSGKQYL